MKRIIVLAAVLFGLLLVPTMSIAGILFMVDAPQDNREVRRSLSGCFGQCRPGATNLEKYPELKPLNAEYKVYLEKMVSTLQMPDAVRIFGPPLGTLSNWWVQTGPKQFGGSGFAAPGCEYPGDWWTYRFTTNELRNSPLRARYPADLVLPMFAPEMWMISGLHSRDPKQNKNHTDLHAIGDIGYLKLFYSNDGRHLQTGILYFRADFNFVPLKSINDIPNRVEWEKKKFDALKTWLQEHGAVPAKKWYVAM